MQVSWHSDNYAIMRAIHFNFFVVHETTGAKHKSKAAEKEISTPIVSEKVSEVKESTNHKSPKKQDAEKKVKVV